MKAFLRKHALVVFLIIVIIGLLLALAVQARAAATTSWTKLSSKVWKCTVAWSGTSSNTTIADAG
ncbi:MAG: hypothetical protein JRJ69_14105, partial [Deltaproteobacteria bacterium]|nr:hypothetical protein [Deltaproteobacteria bacterium]